LSELHLNVGSGYPGREYEGEGWVNVDMQPFNNPPNFVQANVLEGLPFADNTFDSARAIHVLEHIHRDLHQGFLEEVIRVLKKGGDLFIEVPNFIANCENVVDAYKRGDLERVRIWTLSMYGKQRHEGDAHCWGFTPEILINKMRDLGLQDVKRSRSMISKHYMMEPVILVIGTK